MLRYPRVPRMRIQPINGQSGAGFFDSIGRFFKRAGNTLVDNLKRPSTYLGAAGMLPTPLAPVFKGASLITRLAGQGKKRKGAKKKKAQKGGKRKRKARK